MKIGGSKCDGKSFTAKPEKFYCAALEGIFYTKGWILTSKDCPWLAYTPAVSQQTFQILR